MLIKEQIKEIKNIHKELNDTLENLNEQIKEQYEQAHTTSLENLQQSLESKLETHITQKLSKSTNALSEQNTQELQKIWNESKKEILKDNDTLLNNAKEQLEQKLNAINESFLKEFAKTLPTQMLPQVQETLYKSLKIELEKLMLKEAEVFLNSFDLGRILEYDKISIDLDAIISKLKQDRDMQEALQGLIKLSTQEFLESKDTQELIAEALKEHTPFVYKEALKDDEIIKMRYETSLRLSSIQLMQTNELIALITQSLSKEHFKPQVPSGVRNNVLVSR